MRKLILLLLILISSTSLVAQTVSRVDSILAQLQTLPIEERLTEYERICRGGMQFTVPEEGILIGNYRREANKAENLKHECTARTLKLYSYYNNGHIDSLYKTLDENVAFMERHKFWVNYYSCRSLHVEALNYDNKMQSALRESRSIYTHANLNKINYGRGIAAYLIGSCYQSLYRNKDAAIFFLEAEKYLTPENNVGQMHNLYTALWQTMANNSNYDEVLALAHRWENLWTNYCNDRNMTLESIAPFRISYILVRAHTYIKLDRLPEARVLLDTCVNIGKGIREVNRLMLYKEQANYFEKVGQYDSAIYYTDLRIGIQEKYGYRLTALLSKEKRAQLLNKVGESAEAVNLYEDLMVKKDSLYRMDLAAQLDDLNYIYKVDELNAAKAKMEILMMFSLIGFLTLILIIVGYVVYRNSLNIKNKLLMQQIRLNKQRDEDYHELLAKMPDKVLNTDEINFKRLTTLLKDPKVLTNSDLKREDVAQMLGMNHNQVARLVKSNTDGMELIIYINKLRVGFACSIIAKQPDMSVRDLAVASGFNSHTTFIRSFKEFTGMTPGEYKKNLTQ